MSADTGLDGADDRQAVQDAARALMARYGEDGAVVAVLRAAEAAALGDLAQSDHWQAVAAWFDAPDGPVH